MATYAELREQVVQGVVRGLPASPPLDRIRAIFDASFFQLNSTTAESFAAIYSKRELLRRAQTITFTDGTATLPSDVLKKYVEDGTFTIAGARYGYLPLPDFLRAFDKRLGYWTIVGDTITAKKPVSGAVLTGDAETTFICSPEVPATENAEFEAPSDYVPDLLGALIEYTRGAMQEVAAKTA